MTRVRSTTHSRAPLLHGHYPVSSLLFAPPTPSRRQPTSRCCRLYGLPSFRRFLVGARRASPVARRILATMPSVSPRRRVSPRQPLCGKPCCLHPDLEGSASGIRFRGHISVDLHYGLVTRHRPFNGVVDGLQRPGFPDPLPSKLQGYDYYPGRTNSC